MKSGEPIYSTREMPVLAISTHRKAASKSSKSGWRGQKGQSMVEIAFLMPIFLTFIFAILEIGRLWAAKQTVTIAAREGSRILVLPYGAGLTYASEGDVLAAANAVVRDYMNSSVVPVSPTTRITPVRVTPGNDNIFGTTDDVYEKNYSDGKRGDRVGIVISHDFETPIAAILGMFESANFSTVFKMNSASLMDHE